MGLQTRLHQQLIELLADRPNASSFNLIEAVRQQQPLLDSAAVTAAVTRVRQWTDGLGPVESLLGDPTVSEVMINGPGPIWTERDGRVGPTDVVLGATDIELLIERILDPLGLRVDRSSPLVDARLADGSRVNVVIPPLAIDGPTVTIRRFPSRAVPLSAFGPAAVVELLTGLAKARVTMLIVGETAAGKTTLLNAVASLFDPDDRIVTIEDTAELRLLAPHVVRLEARPANSEGVGAVGLRDLVRNAMRMRPDRLVIGEVRGPEALDLILALNTGHAGSMATCHAADAISGLRRLESLALLGGGDVPLAAVRSQLIDAIDIVVHVTREGPRRFIGEVAAVAKATSSGELRLESLWSADERCRQVAGGAGGEGS